MFQTIDDFLTIWQAETAGTIRLFRLLTDESLSRQIGDKSRTLGRLSNHIIETLSEMPKHMGLPLEEEHPQYQTAAEIVAGYEAANDRFVEALESNWNDADLQKETNMYGEHWKIGYSLFVLITHQAHHRGQVTVLMRQAGLKVIGLYGPSREEWESMDIPAMA
jgi:uncharacterized damage-inducible protein DinB